MLQKPRNRFTLTYLGEATYFTPKNWKELDVLISRDRLAVDLELTAELELFGAVATTVSTAYAAGANVSLRVETCPNDWSDYTDAWDFTSDMTTYKKKGSIISLGFNQNTCKDEIEKNKSTKYDLDIPSDYSLSFTGVNRDKTNAITSIIPPTSKNVDCQQFTSSTWIAYGVKTQTERSNDWIFTDQKGFYARALGSTTAKINFRLGKRQYLLYKRDDSVQIKLIHGQINNGVFVTKKELYTNTWISRTDNSYYTFYGADRLFENDGTEWMEDGVPVGGSPIVAGDFVGLFIVTAAGQLFVCQSDHYSPEYDISTKMEFFSENESLHVDYPVSVVSSEWILTQLLSKMCATPPALIYNLPKYNEAGYYVPVFSSGSSLQHSSTPKMSVSFDDMMKFLRCKYGADYEVGSSLTVDYAYNFFKTGVENKAMDVIPIAEPELESDTEHVYNTVEVGWETDDNVENGQDEILCKNVFKINGSTEDKKLDLVSPFKGSPYTIEQYLDDKASETSKTKDQDNDVFVFCVVPFTSGTTTTLYKGHTGATATYYNVPLSPMRFLIANARYIGVSLYRLAKELEFVSTDRNAEESTRIGGESVDVVENDGADATLVAGLSNPLFLPERLNLKTIGRMTKAEIEDRKHKYFEAIDKKGNILYQFYLNDLSLPLTIGKVQDWIGIRTEILT